MFPFVMAIIDTNRDGVISTREQSVYAERVLADLSLAVNGDRLELWLISTNFPEIDTMKEGLGEIAIDFAADLRRGGPERKLVFDNITSGPIAIYPVNCLVPQDSEIRATPKL